MSLVSREYNIYHACTMRMSYWRTPAHNIGRSHAKIMRHEIGCCLIFSGISENSGDFRIASVKIVHVLFFVLRKRGFKLSSASLVTWLARCHLPHVSRSVCFSFSRSFRWFHIWRACRLPHLPALNADWYLVLVFPRLRCLVVWCGEEFDNMTPKEI